MDNGLWRVILCMVAFPLLYTGLITFRCQRCRVLLRGRAWAAVPSVPWGVTVLVGVTGCQEGREGGQEGREGAPVQGTHCAEHLLCPSTHRRGSTWPASSPTLQ